MDARIVQCFKLGSSVDDKNAFESKAMRRRCAVGTDLGATWEAKTHSRRGE